MTECSDDELRTCAMELVHPGFLDLDDAKQSITEIWELPEGDPRATAVVDEVWRAHSATLAAADRPSQYSRMAAAFSDLGERGVVARMNFTCCNTCAVSEIDDEREPGGSSDYPFQEWGYAYFHSQDAERLAELPAQLYIGFGVFPGSPQLPKPEPGLSQEQWTQRHLAADGAVAQLVADRLRAHGLPVVWSGDPQQRIVVPIDDWRKPLPDSSDSFGGAAFQDPAEGAQVSSGFFSGLRKRLRGS